MPTLNRLLPYKNPAHKFHVCHGQHGRLIITNQPDHFGPIQFSAATYGECQQYVYAAEKRQADAKLFVQLLITGVGIAGSVWIVVHVLAGLLR